MVKERGYGKVIFFLAAGFLTWSGLPGKAQAQFWNPYSPQFKRPQPNIPAAGRGLVPTWQYQAPAVPRYQSNYPPNYGPGTGKSGPEGQRLYVHTVPYQNLIGGSNPALPYSTGSGSSGSPGPRIIYDDSMPKR